MIYIKTPPGDTPIWQLTVQQFENLLQNSLSKFTVVIEGERTESVEKRYVHGVSGIKSLFNCSYPTAHKLKETIIKPAVHQQGRVILVDADLALKLFQEHQQVKSVRDLSNTRKL